MNIKIETWVEDIYYSYLKITKGALVLYNGRWDYSIKSIKEYQNNIGIDLNYGIEGNRYSTILVKYKEKFFTIPDAEEMYKYGYKYITVKFNKKELSKLISEEDMKEIKEINYHDLVIEWIKLSKINDYFSSLEKYKKYLKRDIYYVEIEGINIKIEELFEDLFEMENKKIVEIESENYKIVNVYLNLGIIWKAFLKKGEKIYLNTEFQISLDVTDIFNKYID